MKKYVSCLMTLILLLGLAVPPASAAYTDVPEDDVLAAEVEKATEYGLMNGYGNGIFGFRDSMTRAQFVTVLGRMMQWTVTGEAYVTPAMEVDQGISDIYWNAISSAAEHDVVDPDKPFRPNAPITRGEMAEMLVRTLGLKSAAAAMEKGTALPFADVTGRKGYIAVAYDIGMTKGTSATTFAPDATATRAQAAAMLLRIYEKLHPEENWTHAYYAISSYSQLELGAQGDAVTLGWSRMTWNGREALLATTSKSSYEYYIPSGYEGVVEALEDEDVKLHLGVYMDLGNGITEMLENADGRTQAVEEILGELRVNYKALGRNPYSGVTIDFEGLRAAHKEDFTAFLQELSEGLKTQDKTLYVCVSPVLTTGAYYDGYDYRAIGDLADRIILMAYDYDARDLSAFTGTEYYKTAAPAPIDQVYLSLRAITNEESGVKDVSKVVLGYSCKNTAWEIDESGKLLSAAPVYPGNDTVSKRMSQEDTEKGWSSAYGIPYMTYTTEDGSRYFLWYEDSRSVRLKLDTARLFGINSISLWRLGTIPDYSDWSWSFQ